MIRFGKSSKGLSDVKSDFFNKNDALLELAISQAQIYAEQPKRKACKTCNSKLIGETFEKFGVKYVICSECTHLNGLHEDTDAFCKAIYVSEDTAEFATSYSEVNYESIERRLSLIYRPKRDFLFDALEELNENVFDLGFAELGSGSGYFLKALQESGIKQFLGHEVSKKQVEFANELIGGPRITLHNLKENVQIISDLKADVLVMLGVLEHVQNPREILNAIRHNKNIKYLFLVVPTFSPSVFFEASFEHIMPRVLVGGHTHLYTDNSLKWLAKEYSLSREAEWWFGTDIFDLFRSISITLSKSNEKHRLSELWTTLFKGTIDELQLCLDKQKLSSQAHILFKVSH